MQTVLAVGPRTIPKIDKRRAFNKAEWPGKNAKLTTVGPTSIPDSRVPFRLSVFST